MLQLPLSKLPAFIDMLKLWIVGDIVPRITQKPAKKEKRIRKTTKTVII